MLYSCIDIKILKDAYILKIPINDYGQKKDTLHSKVTAELKVFNKAVVDSSFIFELKAILEEFIGRKLNAFTEDYVLNTNTVPFNGEQELHIVRKDSTLVLIMKDYEARKEWTKELDIIQAKTLYAILSKAIQQITILENYYE